MTKLQEKCYRFISLPVLRSSKDLILVENHHYNSRIPTARPLPLTQLRPESLQECEHRGTVKNSRSGMSRFAVY